MLQCNPKAGWKTSRVGQKKEYTIPAYEEAGLTPQQAANRLADHFAAISQTVEPLDISIFQPSLQLAIQEGTTKAYKPLLTQHDVYRKLLKIRKPNSRVDGDVPKKLVMKYPFLWAGLAALIFNRIIQSAKWPKEFKVENAVVLHKTENPKMVKMT